MGGVALKLSACRGREAGGGMQTWRSVFVCLCGRKQAANHEAGNVGIVIIESHRICIMVNSEIT